jgi:hypothetical protein
VTQINESALAQRILRREQAASELAAKNARDKQRLRVKRQRDRKKQLSRMLRQIEQLGLHALTEAEFYGALAEVQVQAQEEGSRERWRGLALAADLASPGSGTAQSAAPFLRETGDARPTHQAPLPDEAGLSG